VVDVPKVRNSATGARIEGLRRRAKYLLFDLTGGHVMLIHLGMSGRLGMVPANNALLAHDHVIWRLDADHELRFNDTRRFGMLDSFSADEESEHPRLVHLGIEPLGRAFSAKSLYEQTRSVKKPIKNFLMDGSRIVGVGNIYACEALFRARISPQCPAGKLTQDRCKLLVESIKKTLRAAIKQGGTTLRDFRNGEGEAGYFAVSLNVYGREKQPCVECGRRVRRIIQSGRSTFYCSRCQAR